MQHKKCCGVVFCNVCGCILWKLYGYGRLLLCRSDSAMLFDNANDFAVNEPECGNKCYNKKNWQYIPCWKEIKIGVNDRP